MTSRMTVLEGLFPEQVRCVLSTDFPAEFELLGAERDQLAAMTAGRRREFIHGRSCARLALAGLGRAIAEVGAVIIVGGNINHVTRVMTTAIALETSKGNLALALGLGIILIGLSVLVNGIVMTLRGSARRMAYA